MLVDDLKQLYASYDLDPHAAQTIKNAIKVIDAVMRLTRSRYPDDIQRAIEDSVYPSTELSYPLNPPIMDNPLDEKDSVDDDVPAV